MKQDRNNWRFTAAALRQAVRPDWLGHLADYWTLTKPEVNFLVLVSALVGFYLAAPGAVQGWLLFHTLVGTLLVASGTGTLNQYLERRTDACMRRTATRPLPAGRLAPAAALWFGILISVAGGAELWVAANPLTSGLALSTLVTYLALYTPLKRRTPLCTVVGAFPGAMPPLIGWAAVRNGLHAGAWVLYAILFLWQFPHLLAIAWMYRDDYARGFAHAAEGRSRRPRHRAANSGLHAGAPAGEPDSGFHGPSGMALLRGRRNSGSGIPVLWCAHGECALERACPAIAYGLDRVFAIGVRAVDVRPGDVGPNGVRPARGERRPPLPLADLRVRVRPDQTPGP